jgi:aryl-alcohol dehydrogenase-like predicted oxidoreductase
VGQNLDKNEKLFLALREIALRKGCTTGQLALAWVQHQGDDVVAIPGTTKLKNFDENVGSLQVKLSKEDIIEIEALFDADAIAGDRNSQINFTFMNSDTPPLSSWQAP